MQSLILVEKVLYYFLYLKILNYMHTYIENMKNIEKTRKNTCINTTLFFLRFNTKKCIELLCC